MPSLYSELTGPLYEDPVPSVVLTGRLQWQGASQQDAFEDRKFLDNLMSTENAGDKKLHG